DPKTGPDIWVFRMDGSKKRARLLGTPAVEQSPSFSPNMRWMAYSSAEAGGVTHVYVRELVPDPGEAMFRAGPGQIVSRTSGARPQWRADGKELFYQTDDNALVAVATPGAARPVGPLDAGDPVVLFHEGSILPFVRSWSVSRDGTRFLFASVVQEA